ncbi:MAG: pyridoxal phosphate-dependent aminotransferase [Bdellovibrionota bacterium]
MTEQYLTNDTTALLPPYPMEELKRIKGNLLQKRKEVFDFGTGDPRIPLWPEINDTIRTSLSEISQYPSIVGQNELSNAHLNYLERRLGLTPSDAWKTLPTRGSKEAIFHIALSIVGRSGGKKNIIIPNPGYPVYRTSAIFSGATPISVDLMEENDYLLEPWKLEKRLVKDAAAIWVNYPNNPTGVCAPRKYWENLIDWCQQTDTLLLSDDCYLDIYPIELDKDENKNKLPVSPLSISQDRVIAFFSLSKRSGMTGFRAGMIAGDSRFITPHIKARSNFGLGQPDFIQRAAAKAWSDDIHVAERRKIFSQRIKIAAEKLKELGLLERVPDATFYLWCKVPKQFNGNDIKFCLDLAEQGVITTPSSWLGENINGMFRLALVPDEQQIKTAMDKIEDFLTKI